MAWPGRGAIHAGLSTPSTKGCGRITTSCRQMWFKNSARRLNAVGDHNTPRHRGFEANLPRKGPRCLGASVCRNSAKDARLQVSSRIGRAIPAAILLTFVMEVTAHAQPALRSPGEGGSPLADRIESGDRRAALAMLAGRVDVN